MKQRLPRSGDEVTARARSDDAEDGNIGAKKIVSDASNTILSMETTGFEPATFALRTQRSPN